MMTVNRSEVKRMSYEERLRHYEQEKNEFLSTAKSLTAIEIQDSLKALMEKWLV